MLLIAKNQSSSLLQFYCLKECRRFAFCSLCKTLKDEFLQCFFFSSCKLNAIRAIEIKNPSFEVGNLTSCDLPTNEANFIVDGFLLTLNYDLLTSIRNNNLKLLNANVARFVLDMENSASSSRNRGNVDPRDAIVKEIRAHEIAIAELNSLSSSRTVYQRNGNLFFRTTPQKATAVEQKLLGSLQANLEKMNTQ